MTIHFGLGDLGTPVPTGTPQPSLVDPSNFGLPNMTSGNCCYDPSRPSWMPSWYPTDAEQACIDSTNNCAVAAITNPSMSISACAGTLNADGSCTVAPSVNDPNNTAGQLSTGDQGFSTNPQATVTGLTPGGCPQGQKGTYPNCGNCAWYQSGTYPNCSGTSNTALWAIGAIAVFIFAFSAGRGR